MAAIILSIGALVGEPEPEGLNPRELDGEDPVGGTFTDPTDILFTLSI